MYLDMNGIIHACTHPNDNDASNTLTMREMMLAIFRYIDRMVSEIAKPKKVLFMAIDGCAPRAKMNQQRARRFRAAQDRLESMDKARQAGEVIDESATFDSNCITPGTEFMEQVGKHLRWFIRKKIKDDPIWRNLEIVFSGHDVPGEGEHKIMQFIRDLRSRPDYEPNQRHCMYGGDADLIMLGLATHEPHFCLLREVVNFNRQFGPRPGQRETVIRQTKEAQFQLMHISMVREYIELDLALGCGRAVDKERIVDDFIFLTFLVGNDFLPHLPTLDIGEHAFDVVFSAYKSLLTESEGYLVTSGELQDMTRLEALFRIIGEQEMEILANREDKEKEFKSKKRGVSKAQIEQAAEEDEALEEERQRAYELAVQEALGAVPAKVANVSLGLDEAGAAKGKDFRGRYYYEKFKIIPGIPASDTYLYGLTTEYMKGLMWCLAYYIKGCVSWTWYFPYNYGPLLTDMRKCSEMQTEITFTLGGPFLPFQQLLGCLPPLSRRLLPTCYQWLMSAVDSPVLEFYPNDFDVDQDGKKNPWEAVVLLPFIDEKRLLSAEALHCPAAKITRDELGRNTFGKIMCYRFDPNVNETYLSCNPEIGLPDVVKCSSICIEMEPDYNCGHPFRPEVVEGTLSPIPGYPSLGVLPIINVETDFMGVNVFGTASKYRTIAVEFQPKAYNPEKLSIAKLLGRSCWCNYPSMHEAKVVAVSDATQEIRMKDDDLIRTAHNHVIAQKWAVTARETEDKYLKGNGFPGSAGLVIGEVGVLLTVVPLQGMHKDPVTGALKKVFSNSEASLPLQMALWASPCVDQRFVETGEQTVAQMFPLDSVVLGTVGSFRGMKGKVVGHHGGAKAEEARSVDVEFTKLPAEPAFGYIIDASITEEYFSSQDICRALKISGSVLGRIVGALFVDHASRADIGLNLKRNGQYALHGYVRKVEEENSGAVAEVEKGSVWERANAVKVIGTDLGPNVDVLEEKTRDTWEYSVRTVNVLMEYRATFPVLFDNMHSLPNDVRKYTPSQLFGEDAERELKRCNAWLNAQPLTKMARTPLSTRCLSKEAVRAVERAADVRGSYLAAQAEEKMRISKVPLDAVYRDGFYSATERPTTLNSTAPRLGDRVVNLSCTGVPFGLKGTVVTIHASTGYVEVLYDEEFVGGRPLQGSCSQFRGRLSAWSGLLCIKKAEQILSQDPVAAAAVIKAAQAKKLEQAKAKAQQPAAAPAPAKPASKAASTKTVTAAPGKAKTADSGDISALLKAKLNIGSAPSAAPAPAAAPPAAALPPPSFDFAPSGPPIVIDKSDGSGRAALAAAAGDEVVDVLSELPIEPPMAGVIQYLPVNTRPIRAPNTANYAPAPRAASPAKKSASASAPKKAVANAKPPKEVPSAKVAKVTEAKKSTEIDAATMAVVAELAGDAAAAAPVSAEKPKKKASGKALLAALRDKAKGAAGADTATAAPASEKQTAAESDLPPPVTQKQENAKKAPAPAPAPAPVAAAPPTAPDAAAKVPVEKKKAMIPASLLLKKKKAA